MIKNFYIRTAIKDLKVKKDELVAQKQELSNSIKDIGITKQAAWKQKTGKMNPVIDEDALALRKQYSSALQQVECKIIELNKELKELYKQEDDEYNNGLMNLFKEIFTTEQMQEMSDEVRRRMKGESPLKISFNIKESIEQKENCSKYRSLASEQLNKMIEFRILLTKVIDEGCSKFGQAEFLTLMSPLNRLIIPVNELNKIKLKNNLK